MTVTTNFSLTLDTPVATSYTAGPAFVEALLNSDFIIVQDHSAHVHTQVFDRDGVPLVAQHQINFGQLDTEGPTALLNNGTIVVLSRDIDSVGFTIQSYTGDAAVVPTTDTGVAGSDQGRVVALSNGGFVITYMDPFSPTDTDIHAKIYNSAGVLQDTIIVDSAGTVEDNPAATSLIGGGFVVAWESGNSIRYAVYNDDGSVRVATQTLVSSGTDQKPALVALQDGGFAIAYQTDKFSAADTDIALARFTDGGTLVYDRNIAQSANDEGLPSVSLLNDGLLAIGYTSSPPGSASQTVLIIVDAVAGALAGGTPLGTSAVAEDFASVATLSDGRVVAISTDGNGMISGGIYGLGPRYWTSDDASDAITGFGGVDVMYGGLGNDSLFGGLGDDTLDGSDGTDVFSGGFGNNQIIGGRGPDTVDYRFTTATVVVNLQLDQTSFSGQGAFNDTLLSIENVTLGSGDDFVFASDATNIILAGGGGDYLDGAFGLDTIMGEAGRDTIFGGFEANLLDGGDGNDSLSGGAGSDLMTGGKGRDTMAGGSGADTFDFNAVPESGKLTTTWDTITDFAAGRAGTFVDRIDVATIDAIRGGADDAFQFVLGGFTAAGQISAAQVGQDVLVSFNTFGRAGAEMTLLLQNVALNDIGAGDFIL